MSKLVSLFFLSFSLIQVSLFAQEGEALPPTDQGLWQTLIMIAIALLFFYVILWRPEQKRRKEAETLRNSMSKGDRVNAMGIIGTVSKVGEETVILTMVDGNKIEVLKAAITDVQKGAGRPEGQKIESLSPGE